MNTTDPVVIEDIIANDKKRFLKEKSDHSMNIAAQLTVAYFTSVKVDSFNYKSTVLDTFKDMYEEVEQFKKKLLG